MIGNSVGEFLNSGGRLSIFFFFLANFTLFEMIWMEFL